MQRTVASLAYHAISERIAAAAQRAGRNVRLLAVSKMKPASAIRELVAAGQHAFGENYVQEALTKQREFASSSPGDDDLEWHLIGPLQSNKCRQVAEHFHWLQTLDREKLIAPLSRCRSENKPPLNVLIQVNIDDETSKSGCAPEAIDTLARHIAATPRLCLRGLMAIPEPSPDLARRRAAFRRMRALYDELRLAYPDIDTLSIGMSEDFELAIEEGATLVRIGSAIFGPRG